MYAPIEHMKDMVKRSIRRDRAFEPRIEAMSRRLWPWREPWLAGFVGLLILLDYVSTYAALELSGNKYLYEGGAMASWALRIGGFPMLFWVDVGAAGVLLLLAAMIRFACYRFGFKGFGRAAFVVLLVPYVVVTMGIIFNNIVMTFL